MIMKIPEEFRYLVLCFHQDIDREASNEEELVNVLLEFLNADKKAVVRSFLADLLSRNPTVPSFSRCGRTANPTGAFARTRTCATSSPQFEIAWTPQRRLGKTTTEQQAEAMGAWLGPGFGAAAADGAGLRLWYDADQVEALSPEREALWARVGAAAFLTVNEKRAAVGYGPAEGGDGRGPAG